MNWAVTDENYIEPMGYFPAEAELQEFQDALKDSIRHATQDEKIANQRKTLESKARTRPILAEVLVDLALHGPESPQHNFNVRLFQISAGNMGLQDLNPELYQENPNLALRFLRKHHDVGQKQLAKFLGKSVTFVSRLESGEYSAPEAKELALSLLSEGVIQTIADRSQPIDATGQAPA